MTTGPRLRPDDGRGVVLTTLPRPGAVFVRAAEPPAVREGACADVRPGALVVLDGDRRRGTLHVECGGERRSVATSDLPGLVTAVGGLLDDGRATVVRFGDRAACRSRIPAPTVAAIERRLRSATEQRGGTLLTWASEAPGDVDRRTYDAVVGGPADRRR